MADFGSILVVYGDAETRAAGAPDHRLPGCTTAAGPTGAGGATAPGADVLIANGATSVSVLSWP